MEKTDVHYIWRLAGNTTKDIYKGLKRSVRCYINPILRSNCLLLNDSGVFCFCIGKKTQRLIAVSISSDAADLDKCLDTVLAKMRNNPDCFCRPTIVLIGGSKCFFSVHRIRGKSAFDPHQILDWLDSERAHLVFRYIKYDEDSRLIYYAGIDTEVYTRIIEKIEGAGIYIGDFMPVSLFLCRCRPRRAPVPSSVVKLPGELIWFYAGDDNLTIIEKCFKALYKKDFLEDQSGRGDEITHYSFFADDTGMHKPLVHPLNSLVYKNSHLLIPRIPFFALPGRGRTAPLLLPLLAVFRWGSLLIIGPAILFLMSAFIMHAYCDRNEGVMAARMAEYQARDKLQREIQKLMDSLNDAKYKGRQGDCFSGAVAAFCQRRPPGLLLQEIKAVRDPHNGRAVIASGSTEVITSILEYRKCVAEYIGGQPIYIAQVKPLSVWREDSSGQTKPSYSFKIKAILGKDK